MKHMFKKRLLILASFSLIACGGTSSGTITYQSGSFDAASADKAVESKVETAASEKGESVSDPTSVVSSFESELNSDSFSNNFTVSINIVETTTYSGATLNVSGNEVLAFDGKSVYFYVNSMNMDSEESNAMEAVFIANANNGYDGYLRKDGEDKFTLTAYNSDDELTSSISALVSQINGLINTCIQALPNMQYDSDKGAYAFSQSGIGLTIKIKDDKLTYVGYKVETTGILMQESFAFTNYGTTKISAPDASLVSK